MVICKLKFEYHCCKKQLRKEDRGGNLEEKDSNGAQEWEVKERRWHRAPVLHVCKLLLPTCALHVLPA